MTKKSVEVSILQPDGELTVHKVRRGFGLQALCAKEPSIPLEFDCRKADCGICLVRVDSLDALSEPTPAERDFLKAMHADPDERLACQCRVMADVRLTLEDAGPP